MANEIRVTDLGVYLELEGFEARVTDLGVYLELISSEIRVTDLGVYLEISPPGENFEINFNGNILTPISIKVNENLSILDSTVLSDTAISKLPSLPTWSIETKVIWNKSAILNFGNLANQQARSLSIRVTDRFNSSITLSNSESFISSYKNDLTIDNILTMDIIFVGSGVLITS